MDVPMDEYSARATLFKVTVELHIYIWNIMSKVATCLALVGNMPVYSISIKVYCKGPGLQKFLPIISPNLQLLTALLQQACDLAYKKTHRFSISHTEEAEN